MCVCGFSVVVIESGICVWQKLQTEEDSGQWEDSAAGEKWCACDHLGIHSITTPIEKGERFLHDLC